MMLIGKVESRWKRGVKTWLPITFLRFILSALVRDNQVSRWILIANDEQQIDLECKW